MKLHFDISPEEELIFINALNFQKKVTFEQQQRIEKEETNFMPNMNLEHGKFIPESNIHPVFQDIFNNFKV